jgi:hypothetical protein
MDVRTNDLIIDSNSITFVIGLMLEVILTNLIMDLALSQNFHWERI